MKEVQIRAFVALMLTGGAAGWFPGGAAFAHGTVDQSNPVSGGASQILAHMPVGQEFTPSQPNLVAVDVSFRGSDGEADTITVNIRKATIASPVLATVSQVVPACPFVPPYTCLVHFELPAPLSVTQGEVYVLELRATRPFHAWQSDFGDGDYPAGAAIIQGSVVSWSDYGFQTYFDIAVDDEDGDGIPSHDDCDDSDPRVYPGSPESYDAKDNDCDGVVDEALDEDGDGVPDFYDSCNGTPAGVGVSPDGCPACAVDPDADADGFPASVDCDDADPAIRPGAPELPGNGTDENCDGGLGACDPGGPWRNHGEFVRCVIAECRRLVASGILSGAACEPLVRQAHGSGIGK